MRPLTGAAAGLFLLGGCLQNAAPALDDGLSGDGPSGSGAGNAGSQSAGAGPGAVGAGGGQTGMTARAFFDANVEPILATSCASCHSSQFDDEGPDYLGDSPASYYASIDAAGFITLPKNSMLLLKGEHTGPALTADQQTQVRNWFEMEVVERGLEDGGSGTGGGGQGPPAVTLQEALDQFGKCMSIGDWDNLGMDNVPNQNTTNGPCHSCHQTGTGGAFLSQDANQTFENNRTMPYVLKLVLGTVNPDGSFKDLVPANRFIDKGSEGTTHPKFLMTPERQLAVKSFFDTTYAKWKAGPCP